MEYKWLNKSENKNIIIFFNGWGMDEGIVNNLEPEEYDVLMFYNYNDLNTEFNFKTLDMYADKYLVAWSMGVMVGTLFDINYTKKVAINGTLLPIDDNYGIPKRIYELTIRGFNEESSLKFINNMLNETCKLPNIKRNIEEQKNELIALKKYQANTSFKYDKIIISSNDKIIPTKNQVAYWGLEPNINSGHAPFMQYKKWNELL